MPNDAELARLRVLETFRWLHGDAYLTPVFRDAATLSALGPGLAEPFCELGVTLIVSPEARGLLLGSMCAVSLGVGFVAARKTGDEPRPGERVRVTSRPDWKGRRVTFEVARVFDASDRVLLVDDWIETGSQLSAVTDAITQAGATVIGTSVIVDQAPQDVRSTLNVIGLLKYDQLPPVH